MANKSRTKTRKASTAKPKKALGRGTAMPQPNGGILFAGAGNGPKKGAPNAGRPPDQWKKALQALADREEVLAHIDRALLAGPPRREPNPDAPALTIEKGDPFFEKALDYVTDHGYGKATQPVALSGSISLAPALKAARERAAKR